MITRVILTLFLLHFTVTLGATPKKITLVYEVQPNPPFYLGMETIDWKKPGVTLEVLKLLEDKLNIKIEFYRRPWARGLMEVKMNRVDGIFHASFKEERLKIGVYPMKDGKPDADRKIVTQSYFLFKRKDSPLLWNGQYFSNLNGSIGVIIDYAITGDLQKMGIDVFEARTQLNNLNMLVKGRVAGVVDLEAMSDFYIKKYPEAFQDIVKVYPPIKRTPYYLMFSHDFVRENPELAESIWDTIREIHNTEEYAVIVQKYLQ